LRNSAFALIVGGDSRAGYTATRLFSAKSKSLTTSPQVLRSKLDLAAKLTLGPLQNSF
jgi:hypothetical protein